MDKVDSKNSEIYFWLPKGGRPVMGAGLEGIELKNYLYKNKVSKKILLTFTEYEFDLLNQKYEAIREIVSIDRNSFIKKSIFEGDSANLIKQKNNNLLVININRIGVNVNQLVKKVNGYSTLNDNIIYQINEIQKEINSIYKIISSFL